MGGGRISGGRVSNNDGAAERRVRQSFAKQAFMTLIGARWAAKGSSCDALKSLPPLKFGVLPPRRLPSLETLQKVRSFVDSAL